MYLKSLVILLVIHFTNGSNETCPTLLKELGDKQSKFTYCITKHSVPVTVCTQCYDEYIDILKIYDLLATSCSSLYFDKDRINLITSVETMLTGLWSKAFCDDCTNNNNINVFGEKNISFYDCLADSKKNPCEMCKIQYKNLNDFYINLDQHNNGEVCYDMQDSMNRTRNTWSKVLKCCQRKQNMTLFAIALAITSCLPLLFYSSTYFITKHMERNHGVLSNEDPTYNSELPFSSRRYNNNSVNNAPSQSFIDDIASTSNADVLNGSISKTAKSVQKNDRHINEDSENSDDPGTPVNFADDSKTNLIYFK